MSVDALKKMNRNQSFVMIFRVDPAVKVDTLCVNRVVAQIGGLLHGES